MDDQSTFEFEIVNADDEDHTLNNTITDSCELVDASIEDVRNNKKEAVMTDKMVSPEDDSTLNNTISSSCEIVDVTIEDARNNQKKLASTMDLVISLMREVECKEKAAEQTKAEAVTSGLAILAKVEKLKKAQQHAKETNDTHAKEVYAQKVVLATEMKELQFRVSGVLNEGCTSVGDLDEMRKALEKRLSSALQEKELADKEKLKKELSALKALAYEESQMKKLAEESERLKQEAMKNYRLQKFLTDRGHVVDTLDEDMSKKCQDVKLLKESLDQKVSISEVLLSSQTPSIIASSTSFLTNDIPNEGNKSDAYPDDHVQPATEKLIKTPCIIASSNSSSTKEIPKVKNETADSSVVLEKSCGFGLDAYTEPVHWATQKLIKTPPVNLSSISPLTNEIPDKINEPANSHVLKNNFVFGSGALTGDRVQSTTQKQIKTPCIIASSSSSSTNKIPKGRNETADSCVVREKSCSFGLDSSTEQVQWVTQKQIKTPPVVVFSSSSLTNNIPDKINEPADSHVVLKTISTFQLGLGGSRKKRHFKKQLVENNSCEGHW